MPLARTILRTAFGSLALLAASWVHPGAADAIVMQPDGTTIPAGGGTGVQPYLAMHGDSAIDVVGEASPTPETFVPHCHLTFTLVVHDAGDDDEFGWYNVTPGAAPADAGLHRMLQGSQMAGTSATIDLSLWTGGDIGFYMRNDSQGRTYYSQRAYNPDSAMSMGFIHMLTWNSHAMPDAFYFGWEDLFGSSGNDDDFNDMLVLVQGITCSGGGGACTVAGAMGVCASGTQQCRAGALTCIANTAPSPERCDGTDNDCNGMVDDGSGLCPASEVCDRGVCVPRCVEGGCFEGQVCSDRGTCVETACAAIDCPSGQRCIAGACLAACDGVVCPHGESCRNGRCVDPCAGVTCDTDSVCVDGVCRPSCACQPCSTDATCGPDGRCADTACAAVSCATGQYCEAGACHDACESVHCPAGQQCTSGNCVDAPDAGSPDAGGLGDAGGHGGLDAGGVRDAGGTRDSGTRADGGTRPSATGCGCRAAAGHDGVAGRGWIALVAMGVIAARRRRAQG